MICIFMIFNNLCIKRKSDSLITRDLSAIYKVLHTRIIFCLNYFCLHPFLFMPILKNISIIANIQEGELEDFTQKLQILIDKCQVSQNGLRKMLQEVKTELLPPLIIISLSSSYSLRPIFQKN